LSAIEFLRSTRSAPKALRLSMSAPSAASLGRHRARRRGAPVPVAGPARHRDAMGALRP
jgi:hypothetical protein